MKDALSVSIKIMDGLFVQNKTWLHAVLSFHVETMKLTGPVLCLYLQNSSESGLNKIGVHSSFVANSVLSSCVWYSISDALSKRGKCRDKLRPASSCNFPFFFCFLLYSETSSPAFVLLFVVAAGK
jgi:hypothetical protein